METRAAAEKAAAAAEKEAAAAETKANATKFAAMTPEERAGAINDGSFTIADQKAIGDAAMAVEVDCTTEPTSPALCAKLKAMRARSIKKRAAAWKYVEENFAKVMSGEEIHISLDGVDYMKSDEKVAAEKEAAASGIAEGDPNGNYLTAEEEESAEWAEEEWEATPEEIAAYKAENPGWNPDDDDY